MVLIFVGVGAAFYAFGVLIETVIDGRINELLGRRRMEQSIASLNGHVIICGWGRVGRAIVHDDDLVPAIGSLERANDRTNRIGLVIRRDDDRGGRRVSHA